MTKQTVKDEYMKREWIANQAKEIITANYEALADAKNILKKDGQPTANLAKRLDTKERGGVGYNLADGQPVNLIYTSIQAGYSRLELRIRARRGVDYFEYSVYLGRLTQDNYNYINNAPIKLESLEDILEQIEAYKPQLDLQILYGKMNERETLLEELKSLENTMPSFSR